MSSPPPFICEESVGERTRAVARRECVVPGQRWSWWISTRIAVDREWAEWIPAIAKCIFFSRMKFMPTRVSRSTVNMDWARIPIKPCLSKRGLRRRKKGAANTWGSSSSSTARRVERWCTWEGMSLCSTADHKWAFLLSRIVVGPSFKWGNVMGLPSGGRTCVRYPP
jgi:hypothetical protein